MRHSWRCNPAGTPRGRDDAGSMLGTWASLHRRLFIAGVALAGLGLGVATLSISVRTPHGDPAPTFSTAILWPSIAASLAVYLALPVDAPLEATAARPLFRARFGQTMASVLAAFLLVLPAAAFATRDAERIVQNVGVFVAGGLLGSRFLHPVVGIVLPWVWALSVMLFGLRYSDLHEQQWAWWAWIIADEPSVMLGVSAVVTSAVVTASRSIPRHRGNLPGMASSV